MEEVEDRNHLVVLYVQILINSQQPITNNLVTFRDRYHLNKLFIYPKQLNIFLLYFKDNFREIIIP